MKESEHLRKALKNGKISKEFYEKKISEIETEFLENEKQFIEERLAENPTLTYEDGHFVTNLCCPKCKKQGIIKYERQDFKLLGKDKRGYIYFECPDCLIHIQWDSISGNIKSNKGILGKLFNKFT